MNSTWSVKVDFISQKYESEITHFNEVDSKVEINQIVIDQKLAGE
jgi:hypothetical protein